MRENKRPLHTNNFTIKNIEYFFRNNEGQYSLKSDYQDNLPDFIEYDVKNKKQLYKVDGSIDEETLHDLCSRHKFRGYQNSDDLHNDCNNYETHKYNIYYKLINTDIEILHDAFIDLIHKNPPYCEFYRSSDIIQIANQLINHGVDLKAVINYDNSVFTLMQYAARFGNSEIIKVLYDHGANLHDIITISDHSRKTLSRHCLDDKNYIKNPFTLYWEHCVNKMKRDMWKVKRVNSNVDNMSKYNVYDIRSDLALATDVMGIFLDNGCSIFQNIYTGVDIKLFDFLRSDENIKSTFNKFTIKVDQSSAIIKYTRNVIDILKSKSTDEEKITQMKQIFEEVCKKYPNIQHKSIVNSSNIESSSFLNDPVICYAYQNSSPEIFHFLMDKGGDSNLVLLHNAVYNKNPNFPKYKDKKNAIIANFSPEKISELSGLPVDITSLITEYTGDKFKKIRMPSNSPSEAKANANNNNSLDDVILR